MSIENPRTNITNDVNRGDHVPSAETPDTPRWPGPESDPEGFPRQRESLDQKPTSSTETYTVPQERSKEAEPSDEKPGFFKRTTGKVALGVAGVVTAGAAFFAGTQQGESDRPPQTPPVATAESQPSSASSSTAAPSSTEVAPSKPVNLAEAATPYDPSINKERGNKSLLVISEKLYPLEKAKQELFTITKAEAPTAEAALKLYFEKALQSGMNINTNASTPISRGGVEATKLESEEIIESGMLSNLGENHNKVNKFATDDQVLPGTLVWEVNQKNIQYGLESRNKAEEVNLKKNAADSYTARGKLLTTGYLKDIPQYTDSYGFQLTMKVENGAWKFPKPYTWFTRDNVSK